MTTLRPAASEPEARAKHVAGLTGSPQRHAAPSSEPEARATHVAGVRALRRQRRALRAMLALVLGPATGPGCIDPGVTGSRASAGLIIERIAAVAGGASDRSPATYLQSDVCDRDAAAGPCRVFDDIGQVTTRLRLKDPGTPENPTSPTSANFVTIDRYRVRYVRSDGRDRPGIDVPHSWEGAMTATTMAESQTAAFTLVRASAKLEAPLRALTGGGGAVILNTTAVIDFYGHDQTGAGVTATGRIGVHFADWAN